MGRIWETYGSDVGMHNKLYTKYGGVKPQLCVKRNQSYTDMLYNEMVIYL